MSKLAIKEVINNGYCIGCGVCAFIKPKEISIELNDFGQYEARLLRDDINTSDIDSLCPFSDYSPNEDELGQELFGQNTYTDGLGFALKSYAGYVKEGDFRAMGSSGGFGTWICVELLRLGHIDGVIHVVSSDSPQLLFEYGISTHYSGVIRNSKSKYYPVRLDEILTYISEHRGKYLLVGLPCMIKSVRLMAKQNSIIKSSIVYTMGLVCGHIKSKAFAEMLGWQLSVQPNELVDIDFRTKLNGYGANQYGVTVTKQSSEIHSITSGPVNELFGTNWGLGYFKSKACDFCDDVMSETADITIGDAWLPEYINNPEGTNIIVVRSALINELLNNAINMDRVFLEDLSEDRVLLSQSSGISHRRKGLQYRLYLNSKMSKPTPIKRVEPSKKFSRKFKKIQELRILLRDASHLNFAKAKEQSDWNIFAIRMERLNNKYYQLYRISLIRRIWNRAKRLFT